MNKLLLATSLIGLSACATIPDSVVNAAFKIARSAERSAVLIRCPPKGKEREAFLAARAVFDESIRPRLSPERQTELDGLRKSADVKCEFTPAEAEAAVLAAEG